MQFLPAREPANDRTDAPALDRDQTAEWGSYGRSDAVRAVIGAERYDAFHPEGYDGMVGTVDDLHDATIVEITALLRPHADDHVLGALAREWAAGTGLVRDGTIREATIAFTADVSLATGYADKALITLNATAHEVVLTIFCQNGDEVLGPPVVYWSEDGYFSTDRVEDDVIDEDMVDRQSQMMRWERTRAAVEATRAQAALPEGVVGLASFRQLRDVRS